MLSYTESLKAFISFCNKGKTYSVTQKFSLLESVSYVTATEELRNDFLGKPS